MITLINKILARFQLKLVSTKPVDLVEESVNFLNQHQDYWSDDIFFPPYVGDVVYIQEKVKGEFPQVSGRTYFRHQVLGKEEEYYNYGGDTYTTQELQGKLK
jgi:hypothetical protein